MDYAFWFWVLIAFLAGLSFPRSIYIGYDEEKYKKAEAGILFSKRRGPWD